MHAAKHFDPQMGIDIHLYVFPPLPTPIPLPTPHIGIVLDPFDYLPIIGGTVHVNGVKRATAGTGGLDVHIPLGPWMPTLKMPGGPQWEDELFMGSMTVIADGDPLSRIAMPVLDCNVVGMINPFRVRKPKKPQLSMSLPTALNLAIPNNVNVGGPPMISIMGMLFKGAFAGLGRLAKMRAVKRMMARGRNRWRKLFSHMEPGFLKCKVLRAEPVDTRTGAVSVTHEDFSLPGRLAMSWTRRYRSDEIDHAGVCGWGWTTPADIALVISEDGVVFMPVEGPPAVFDRLPLPGEGLVDPIDGARLSRVHDELHLRTKDDLIHVFAAPPANVVPMPGLPPRRLRIERLEDRCNNAWTFERDGEHLTRIVERGLDDSPGRYIDVASQGGRIHAMALHDPITGQSWPLVKYRHDAHGDLEAALDALDAARTFAYRDHRMVRHTDRVGLSFYYEFDHQARVVHSWGDGGLYDYHFTYHDDLHETEITDSLGHTTLIKFDADGLPLCEIDPLGGCTFFEYDEWGRTTGVTDPNGLRTGFVYDERGNLIELHRPDDSKISTQFDTNDRACVIVDPLGAYWRQTWNDLGLLISQTTPSGAKTTYQYDKRGQLTRQINARDAQIEFQFDAHGQICCIVDAMCCRTMYTTNSLGKIVSQQDALGYTTDYSYDIKGRIERIQFPRGTSIQCRYDAEDQLTEYFDENNSPTRIDYLGLGKISRRKEADGSQVRYLYDSEEQLMGVVNQRGEVHNVVRNAVGNVTSEVDYWGQCITYEYDIGGRIKTSKDPLGRTINFTTDQMGRIIRKATNNYSDGTPSIDENFAYDKAGQLISVRNDAAVVLRRFDAEGNLIEEIQNGLGVRSSFDCIGNRIARHSDIGNRIEIQYDLLNQPISIQINDQPSMSVTRDATGRATAEMIGSQITRRRHYNEEGQIVDQVMERDGEQLFSTQYEYDKRGNIARRQDKHSGLDFYTYDVSDRVLRHVSPSGVAKSFHYDLVGDRLKTLVKNISLGQVLGGDVQPSMWIREGELEGKNYSFDRAGNLIRLQDNRSTVTKAIDLTWDANQRLSKCVSNTDSPSPIETYYNYDGLGRRILKRSGNAVTAFLWDGDFLLGEISETTSSKSLSQKLAHIKHQSVTPFDRITTVQATFSSVASTSLNRREYIFWPSTHDPLALIDQYCDLKLQPTTEWGSNPRSDLERSGSNSESTAPALGYGISLGEDNRYSLGAIDRAASDSRTGASGFCVADNMVDSTGPIALGLTAEFEQEDLVSQVYYFYNEPNGCPRGLINSVGEIVWLAVNDSQGNSTATQNHAFSQPLRLQGQYFDVESGLTYNRYRYFDSHIGQFISQDPIGLDSGIVNLYEFAPNTLTFIDPLGLWNRRRNNGQFAAKPGPKPKPSAHGNSKLSTRPAVLYAQYDENGVFQKWGITQETGNPRKRYGSSLPADWDVIEVARGRRVDMLSLERELSSKLPGPKNLERWAGSNAGAQLSDAAHSIAKRAGCIK